MTLGNEDTDIEGASLTTDEVFTNSADYDVVVWKDSDGTIHATGRDSEIDSGSDAATVIQSAVQSKSRPSVFIAPDTYTISSAISITKSQTTLRGAGRATELQQDSTNLNDIFDISTNDPTRIHISDLYLHGDDSRTGTGINYTISDSTLAKSLIENVLVERFDTGILLSGPSDSEIASCFVNEPNTGVHVKDCTAATVTGGFYRHPQTHGILVESGSLSNTFEHTITGVQIAAPESSGNGITFKDSVKWSTINGSQCISGNGSSGKAIYIKTSEAISVQSFAIGRSFSGDGIVVEDSDYVSIGGCVLNGVAGDGVQFTGTSASEWASVSNCTFNDCGYGIRSTSNMSLNHTAVVGNTFNESDKSAMYLNSNFAYLNVIVGNIFDDSNTTNTSGEGDIRLEPGSSPNPGIVYANGHRQTGTGDAKFTVNVGSNMQDLLIGGFIFDGYSTEISDSGTRTRVNGLGEEAAGGTPTAGDWDVGDVVEDTNNGGDLYMKAKDGTFEQIST